MVGAQALERRLCSWYEQAYYIVDDIFAFRQMGVDWVVLEEPIFSWGRKNPVAFARQNQLLGIMVDQLRELGALAYVNPKSVKLTFTGNGKAEKDDMIERAQKWYPFLEKRKKQREAIADAIGIGYTMWKALQAQPEKFAGVTFLQ